MKYFLQLLITIFAFTYCGPSESTKKLMADANNMFGVLPAVMPGSENDTAELVSLGKRLYFDKSLSENNSQSCNSCHNLNDGMMGVDNLPTSPGARGGNGDRNSPTSVNAGFHTAQFWDGRAPDLKAQAKGPILNPAEMAMPSEAAVMEKLAGIDGYTAMFTKAFPGQKEVMTYDNLAEAIAAFERTLITKDRFDEFQNGKHKALNEQEQRGLEKFMANGCTACHRGNLVGGTMYQKVGTVHPYKNIEDLGRFNVTGKETDKYVFKVPSLRNIAMTAPYFHDGGIATLEEAVKTMAYIQLGKELSDEDNADIVAFLESLNGKLPKL
jgi:cytochrome c peroxidase